MSETDYKDWRAAMAKGTFLVLMVALVATVVYMLHNVLHAIILGVLFAIILMPAHEHIARRMRAFLEYAYARSRRQRHLRQVKPAEYEARLAWRSRLYASILSILLVFFIIAVPLSAFVTSVVRQGITAIPKTAEWVQNDMPRKSAELYEKYRDNYVVRQLRNATEKLVSSIGGNPARLLLDLKRYLRGAEENPDEHADSPDEPPTAPREGEAPLDLSSAVADITLAVLQHLRSFLLRFLSRIGVAFFNFFIMLFVMFHIFLDGKRIWGYLLSVSPFRESDQKRIVAGIRNVTGAIFYSIFGTALIQGCLSMVAFRIVGVPALFWGTLLGICSIIPFVGTGLIWVPVTVYLFLAGQVGRGIFILLFCGCFVANVDSIIRPLLMKRGGKTGMSYMVLFFSILGGLQTFGLIGIIYGPIIVGLCSICLYIFSTQLKSIKRNTHATRIEGRK